MKERAKATRGQGTRAVEKEAMIALPANGQRIENLHLEWLVSWTARERLLCLWHELRLAHSDVEYAFQRMNELQRRLP
jgi:hypothetical protein